ncbi:MAG: LuxR family transcriptional regulator [Paracoccaceae bacterium]
MQDHLTQAKALEELQRITERLRDHYEIEHTVYHWVNSVGERFGCGTYSTEWVDRYLEKDYLHIDPVIHGCFQRFNPVNWKHLDWSGKPARAFMKEAVEYGVGTQGFTIPMRGPNGQFALFTVNHTCPDEVWEQFVEDNQRDLILVAHGFNQRAIAMEEGVFSVHHPTLSPRELSAMTLLAKGRSRAQAADEMNISEHTLRVYIEAARHKLGAMNTTHAVARALAIGLIVV